MNLHRVAFLALVFLAACEGPKGDQGPQGNPGQNGTNYTRDQIYCNRSAGVDKASGWAVSVTCALVADIPIQGSCYASNQPADSFLSSSKPVNWSDGTKNAGWTCTWSWQPGTEPTDTTFSFDGNAEICCAKQP